MCTSVPRVAAQEYKVQYANQRSSGEGHINHKIHLLKVNHKLHLYPEKVFPH